MALMYNDQLMNDMSVVSNTTKEAITKYIIAGINGYRELVTFASEKAYNVQCQQDFLFFLIRNTVNGFYTFKKNIWPFIMANAPILINDIQKGIDTANTVAKNIINKVSGFIDEKNKESNQKAVGVVLGQMTTEKLNEEYIKALERNTRLQLIKQIYDEKIAELKINTEEIKKKQQDADEETNLIRLNEKKFANAFVENEKAKEALNEVKYELQKTIDNAIIDNTNIISFTTKALESGITVASEVFNERSDLISSIFPTNKEGETQKNNLTTALRRAKKDSLAKKKPVKSSRKNSIGSKDKLPGNSGGGKRNTKKHYNKKKKTKKHAKKLHRKTKRG